LRAGHGSFFPHLTITGRVPEGTTMSIDNATAALYRIHREVLDLVDGGQVLPYLRNVLDSRHFEIVVNVLASGVAIPNNALMALGVPAALTSMLINRQLKVNLFFMGTVRQDGFTSGMDHAPDPLVDKELIVSTRCSGLPPDNDAIVRVDSLRDLLITKHDRIFEPAKAYPAAVSAPDIQLDLSPDGFKAFVGESLTRRPRLGPRIGIYLASKTGMF
jgi:hypothetical protein